MYSTAPRMTVSSVLVVLSAWATQNQILVNFDGMTTTPAAFDCVTETLACMCSGHWIAREVTVRKLFEGWWE